MVAENTVMTNLTKIAFNNVLDAHNLSECIKGKFFNYEDVNINMTSLGKRYEYSCNIIEFKIVKNKFSFTTSNTSPVTITDGF